MVPQLATGLYYGQILAAVGARCYQREVPSCQRTGLTVLCQLACGGTVQMQVTR